MTNRDLYVSIAEIIDRTGLSLASAMQQFTIPSDIDYQPLYDAVGYVLAKDYGIKLNPAGEPEDMQLPDYSFVDSLIDSVLIGIPAAEALSQSSRTRAVESYDSGDRVRTPHGLEGTAIGAESGKILVSLDTGESQFWSPESLDPVIPRDEDPGSPRS